MDGFFCSKFMIRIFRKKRFVKIRKFIRKRNRLVINIAAFFVIFFAIGAAWFGANLNNKKLKYPDDVNRNIASEEKKAPETVIDIIQKVKSHIVITYKEEPLIVKIEESEFLKTQQDFFRDAKDGDIVVAYSEKVIIYRPSADILVNVGPVYLPSLKLDEISLEIRNGSKVSGLASSMGNIFEAKDYKIEKIGDASRDDYMTDVVVNISGKNITQLENEVGIQSINYLPEGEKKSNADVVVILGNK